MIINDFDLVCVALFPKEADSPLIVYSNAVLPGSAALESFQMVSWRHPQIIQRLRSRELNKFAEGNALDAIGNPSRSIATPNLFRFFTAEALNHS